MFLYMKWTVMTESKANRTEGDVREERLNVEYKRGKQYGRRSKVISVSMKLEDVLVQRVLE